MKLIFISDLHLSPETLTHNQIFYGLLKSWQGKIDGLYILGDFFDSWVGDDDDNAFIREMKAQLRLFSQDTPTFFRSGNHDFAIGKSFARQTGIKLLPDMHRLQIAGKTILLSHGDTFCTLDLAYQRMKKILQNRITIFILCRLPLKLRYKIKELLEHKSGVSSNTKPQHIYQVVDQSVINYAAAAGASIVIHGHTHRPGCYPLKLDNGNTIQRFEIPDWQDHTPGGYILLEDEKIQLITV